MQIKQLHIDSIDKELLNEIQWVFPLVERPYYEIGKHFGISEAEVIKRISSLKAIGLIRQINAIFDTRRLGYKSALIAFAVEPDQLESVSSEVNKHPGVSHNYERNHEYNMWFTLAVPPNGEMKKDLEKMASLKGVTKYRLLPTLKLYKIGVKLDMVNKDPEKPVPNDKVKRSSTAPFELSERDKDFIRELQKDLEVIPEPFKKPSRNLGVSNEVLFEKAREYEAQGVMRRFAAILRHRDAGFAANGMVVWNVPEKRIDEIGEKLASYPQVSHCYKRPIYPDWQYNLFSMIHARTFEAAEKIAEELANNVSISNYRILFSSREFKKERVRYFV